MLKDLHPVVLTLDFGGTKLSAAVFSADSAKRSTWLALERVYAAPGANGPQSLRTMCDLARKLLGETRGNLEGIGVSFGGPVDFEQGRVRLSHHVPGWEQVPLRDRLRNEFQVPCVIENDANVAALGEWKYGAGEGCSSLLYVTVSTGIGGGWVLNGRIHRGADGMAGEIGHTTVRPNGHLCGCGRQGCLEAEASGPAIARVFRERFGDDRLERPVTAERVALAARSGDRDAQEVLEGAARLLGAGLGAAVNLMNPSRIVMGGGVTKSGDDYWRHVREAARQHALPILTVNIVPARFGDEAPLWGALALAEDTLSL